jgi:hypothetical protein
MRASRRHFTVTAVALCVTVAALALGSASASAATSTATGTIVAVNPADFIIRTAGSNGGKLNQMISYADKLEAKNYPYVYGGGHGKVGVASGGRDKGFDCSGVVAAVLEAGGLWPKNSSVPGDAGIIQQLLKAKLIASGPASGPYQLALFDDPGKDIQEKIGGRFYGTGVGRHGGPGWFDDGVLEFRGYKEYHVLPSVLHERSSYGDYLTFSFGNGSSQEAIANEVTVGAKVQVSYAEAGDSAITAESVKNVGGKPFHPPPGDPRF